MLTFLTRGGSCGQRLDPPSIPVRPGLLLMAQRSRDLELPSPTSGSEWSTSSRPFLSHRCSQPSSVYLHFLCTVSINKVLACNWSHNPHYSTESPHFKESLLLRQSGPRLKASNLPSISLINWISCFYRSSVGDLLLCKYFYPSVVFSLLQASIRPFGEHN